MLHHFVKFLLKDVDDDAYCFVYSWGLAFAFKIHEHIFNHKRNSGYDIW